MLTFYVYIRYKAIYFLYYLQNKNILYKDIIYYKHITNHLQMKLMKLSNKYKTSEYIFLFSILVLALLLGTYFSFYAFLMRDIKSDIKGFSKDLHMNAMNYQEGLALQQQQQPPLPRQPRQQPSRQPPGSFPPV